MPQFISQVDKNGLEWNGVSPGCDVPRERGGSTTGWSMENTGLNAPVFFLYKT
jgi:hypothetical protein